MSIMIWLKNKVANNYIHPETCFCTPCSDLHDKQLYIILQTTKQLILVSRQSRVGVDLQGPRCVLSVEFLCVRW